MKIAFESQLFLNGNKTGIAWVADNLIRGMLKNTDYECQLNYFSKGYSEEELAIMEDYRNAGAILKPCGALKNAWYKMFWLFVRLPYHCFFGDDCQITQFFNYVIPPGVKGKKITIVHDMAHLACRETVKLKNRTWLDLTLKQSCRRADIILTVSEFSKGEIVKYLKEPETKIRVLYPGVNLELFHERYSVAQIDAAKKKYGIDGDYMLYLGTIEPRKNLQRLIEAYEILVKQKKNDNLPKLVLAGGKGWLCDDIYRAAEKAELQGKVLFTGYIEEEDSPLLLSGAKLFCFPSLYEGFGMPPVEAMACGAPVLTAKAASMPEVLGENAVYIDPLSTKDIADGIERVLRDEVLQTHLKTAGPEYAKRYDWANSVETLRSVYESLAQAEM